MWHFSSFFVSERLALFRRSFSETVFVKTMSLLMSKGAGTDSAFGRTTLGTEWTRLKRLSSSDESASLIASLISYLLYLESLRSDGTKTRLCVTNLATTLTGVTDGFCHLVHARFRSEGGLRTIITFCFRVLPLLFLFQRTYVDADISCASLVIERLCRLHEKRMDVVPKDVNSRWRKSA